MRKNLPVTGKEYRIPDHAQLISGTDPQSRIGYANAGSTATDRSVRTIETLATQIQSASGLRDRLSAIGPVPADPVPWHSRQKPLSL